MTQDRPDSQRDAQPDTHTDPQREDLPGSEPAVQGPAASAAAPAAAPATPEPAAEPAATPEPAAAGEQPWWRHVLPVVGVVVLLIGLVLVASLVDPGSRPERLNGDSVGMAQDQDIRSYQDHAAATLAQAPANEPAYALVTFAAPMSPAAAGQALDSLERVSAVVVDGLRIIPLVEPVAPATRADLFARQTARLESTATAPTDMELPGEISSVVVRDTGQRLREFNQREEKHLTAVEVLPPDCAWGQFGIRPVIPVTKVGTQWPFEGDH